jgi:hypothetical protein
MAPIDFKHTKFTRFGIDAISLPKVVMSSTPNKPKCPKQSIVAPARTQTKKLQANVYTHPDKFYAIMHTVLAAQIEKASTTWHGRSIHRIAKQPRETHTTKLKLGKACGTGGWQWGLFVPRAP